MLAAQRNVRRLERSEVAAQRELTATARGSAEVARLELEIQRFRAQIRDELNPARGPFKGFTLEEYQAGRRPNIAPNRMQPGGERYASLTGHLQRAQALLNSEIAGLTQTVAERVASATPGSAAKPAALANAASVGGTLHPVNGIPIDVTTGAPMRTADWAVDHIMPRSEIARDPRFGQLSPLQQLDLLLNVQDNYLPLTGAANSSKGSLSVNDWIRARAAGNRPLPRDMVTALRAADVRARMAIEARFQSFARPAVP
jgi:hypothetical protein